DMVPMVWGYIKSRETARRMDAYAGEVQAMVSVPILRRTVLSLTIGASIPSLTTTPPLVLTTWTLPPLKPTPCLEICQQALTMVAGPAAYPSPTEKPISVASTQTR